MITITTTRKQREIVPVALDIARKLAQDVASGSRRLDIREKQAVDVIGNLAYIRGEFDKVLPAQQGEVDVKLEDGSAKTLRTALGLWAAKVLDRDKSDQQLALTTNATDVHKVAQNLLDQLSDQLSLPIVDITELDESRSGRDESDKDFAAGTSEGPHRGVGKTRRPEDTPEGAKGKRWDRTHKSKGPPKKK